MVAHSSDCANLLSFLLLLLLLFVLDCFVFVSPWANLFFSTIFSSLIFVFCHGQASDLSFPLDAILINWTKRSCKSHGAAVKQLPQMALYSTKLSWFSTEVSKKMQFKLIVKNSRDSELFWKKMTFISCSTLCTYIINIFNENPFYWKHCWTAIAVLWILWGLKVTL